jgi:uncharacterized protein (TIGR03437 family)
VDQPAAASGADYTVSIAGAIEYRVARVLVDADRNTFVTGSRVFGQLSDVFVAKLDPSGNIVFTSTLSGKGIDTGNAIAIDGSGNIYLGGSTSSQNFPLRNPLYPYPWPTTIPGVGPTGFIVKLSSDGSRLLYSTYFPGSINAIAADAAGNLYVTGYSMNRDFPSTPGLPSHTLGGTLASVTGAFITKLNADGDAIAYSAVIAGSSVSCGAGSSCFLSARFTSGLDIRLDSAGNAFVAGYSNTTDLPTTAGAFKTSGIGAFVAKVNAAGTSLGYLTYIGTTNYVLTPFSNPANRASALAVDAAGNAYVAGATTDPQFPATQGAFQTAYHGTVTNPFEAPPADGFLAKFNPQGSALLYATFLGGTGEDGIQSISIDPAGKAWLSGTTTSSDFPPSSGSGLAGGDFIVGVDANGSALVYSQRFPDGSAARSIAVDADGRLHAAGASGLVSLITPGTALATRVFGAANAAAGAVRTLVAPGEVIALYGPGIGAAGTATTLLCDDKPAPVLYAAGNQVNAVVPFGVAGQKLTRLRLTGAPDLTLGVADALPEIFRHSQNGAAVNQDGTLNSQDHRAQPGSVVAIWVTGVGTVSPLPADGEIAQGAQQYYCCQVTVDGQPADVLYSGAAPGIVAGVVQINFRVPQSGYGASSVTVTAKNVTSMPVTLWTQVQP